MNTEVRQALGRIVGKEAVKRSVEKVTVNDLADIIDDVLPGLDDNELESLSAYVKGLLSVHSSDVYFNVDRVKADGTIRTEAELMELYDSKVEF